MKRFFAMVLGALFVVSATPAMAASQIDFSGYYEAMYVLDGNYSRNTYQTVYGYGSNAAGDHYYPITHTPEDNDSYFLHKFNVDVRFNATDQISVVWRFRGPDFARWGANNWYKSDVKQNNLFTKFVYGEIRQDWGTVRIGRINDINRAGLATLGYLPVWGGGQDYYTQNGIFDHGDELDSIFYANEWDMGLGVKTYYAKLEAYKPAEDNNFSKSRDADRLSAEVYYKWDGGGASLAFMYDRDATKTSPVPAYIGNQFLDYRSVDSWYLNPAIMHSWDFQESGVLSVHSELKFGWATAKKPNIYAYDANNQLVGFALEDDKAEGFGWYLDVDYNYGPGNVTLGAWWVNGSDGSADVDQYGNVLRVAPKKNKNLVGVGKDFYPFLVAYNGNAGGNGAFNDSVVKGNAAAFAGEGYTRYQGAAIESNRQQVESLNIANSEKDSNHWAIAVMGNHAFTDEIKMNYGIGYFSLVKPTYSVIESAYADVNTRVNNVITNANKDLINGSVNDAGAPSFNGSTLGKQSFWKKQNKDLGWEIDLGFTFELLENLTFATNFGYFFNGKAFDYVEGYNYRIDQNGNQYWNAVWKKPEDTYTWANTLTFRF